MGFASWMSRMPTVKDTLGVDTSQLGLLILALASGSIAGLVLSAPVIGKVGSQRVMAACLVLAAAGLLTAGVGVSLLGNFVVTAVGLVAFGSGMAMCDVAMNLSGAVNERMIGRTLMPLFHAFFSIGTMLGAAIGAACEHFGVPIATQSIGIAAIIAIAGVAAVRMTQSEVSANAADHAEHTAAIPRRSLWLDPKTMLIGLIVLGMAFAEGAADDWLALAVVEGHNVSKTQGALVFGIFVTAMTAGRLGGGFVLDRFGRVPVLRACAASAAAGLLLFIFVPNPAIAVVGVVLWGLGASLGFPAGMSAAADDPTNATARVSVVATIGYLAFLAGPPAIGFLGHEVGLLKALLLVLALVVLAGILSQAAREPASPSPKQIA